MEEKPKVTVLMSLYNTPETELRQSIESMLNQTYKNYDILIINDGTKDNGVEVIESFKSDKITIVNNENNMGLEKSLNKGLELIDSKYIVRMDTDDISYSNRIEKQVEFMENNSQYAFACGIAELFDKEGIYGKTKMSGELQINDFLKNNPFVHPTMIIRKDIIKKIGGYPLYTRCEDYAMEFEMYYQGYKGYIMDDILIKYRMDRKSYNKKKFKYRVVETKMKLHYFRKIGINKLKYIYAIRPIIVALLPKTIIRKYHKNKYKSEES